MKRNANYLTQRIIDACAHGATLPEIHARVGRSDPTVCVIVGQLVAARRLFKAGSKMTQTYFADVAEAKACSEELERIKAQLDAEDASQKAARRKPKEPQKTPKSGSRRADIMRVIGDEGINAEQLSKALGIAWATASQDLARMVVSGQLYRAKFSHKSARFYKTQKLAELALNRYKQTRGVVAAPVKLKHTRLPADAKVIVPRGVKVTRAEGWTHDVRFQLPPGTRIVGDFMAEWNALRAA